MEHLYLVTYDIRDPKRWRSVFKEMKGFGEWLQYSVFQCRLSAMRHAMLIATLDELIKHREDHVLIIQLGPADAIKPKVTSLGLPYQPISRETIII